MEHGGVIEVAKGISDYGVMIVICAAFIVLSLGMWIAIFKWFKSLINQIVKRSNKDMQDILSEIKKQNEMLCDVRRDCEPKHSFA